MPSKPNAPIGQYLRDHVITPKGITVAEAADYLGVSRVNLTHVLVGRNGVSPEMAMRFEVSFGADAEDILVRQAKHQANELRSIKDNIGARLYNPTR